MDVNKYFSSIKELKFLAKKEVGQNFLIDPDIAKKIVSLLELNESDNVLEIGCGAGSLSYFLSFGPAKATLIDIDESMLCKLQTDFKENEYLNIQYGNAMKFDYSPYGKIVGNLPYYITSSIIEKTLIGAKNASKMVFMIQKEAADRIMAPVNTKDYSPLSVYLSLVAKSKRVFNVSRHCFVPEPHVDSSVILIEFNKKHDENSFKAFKLSQSLFLKRRKTIYNNLKNLLHDELKAKETLEKASIDLNKRPEEIAPEQYLILTKLIEC